MGSIKRFDIRNNLKKFGLEYFVETGTWKGDGLAHAARFKFKELYSIEIMPEIADEAKKRFSGDPRIKIFTGSSTDIFPDFLSKIPGNCLFWLDAHYPGAEEGLKDYNEHPGEIERLPLETELNIIKQNRKNFSDLIIIDDLRIYEDGPFESGNLPTDIIKTRSRNIDFIKDYYGSTHNIKKFFANEGYIIIEPRTTVANNNIFSYLINKKLRHKIY